MVMFTHIMLIWRGVFLPQCSTISPNEHLPGARPLMAGRIENESVIEYPMAMRSVLLRCLVVLVALTFVGGTTVNARTHSMPSGAEGLPCHDTADAGTSINKSPQHQHHNAHACPCCCLGCASFANRAPDGTSGVVPVSAIVSYGEAINALAGRILHPDPYPPRPSNSI
ncbi:hypothetical protein SAMN05443247_04913 [Bradyrhizobium erythrophlei]|jgi:hypothetical protein|nr:hypothetical protein SAMN05443247_04913 [Bradyrhizobium erythrophlei]